MGAGLHAPRIVALSGIGLHDVTPFVCREGLVAVEFRTHASSAPFVSSK